MGDDHRTLTSGLCFCLKDSFYCGADARRKVRTVLTAGALPLAAAVNPGAVLPVVFHLLPAAAFEHAEVHLPEARDLDLPRFRKENCRGFLRS